MYRRVFFEPMERADWMTASAPFFRALVVYRYQVYSVKGADAVIQSASDSFGIFKRAKKERCVLCVWLNRWLAALCVLCV